jgi:hypothetical protein
MVGTCPKCGCVTISVSDVVLCCSVCGAVTRLGKYYTVDGILRGIGCIPTESQEMTQRYAH